MNELIEELKGKIMNNLACAIPHKNCPYYQPTTGQCDYPNTCVNQIEDDVETYITEKKEGFYD